MTTRNRLRGRLTVGVACLILLSSLAGLGLAQSDAGTLTIDSDHDLATSDAVNQYAREEVASTNVPQVDLTVTVAEDHEEVGLDGPRIDARTTYLRLDYDEEIPREVRIYLPAEIVTPRVKQDLESVDGVATADLRPTDNATMQAVTVRFDGETDAVFGLSKEAGVVSETRRWVKEAVSNATGVPVPSLGSGGQWQFVDPAEYGANQTRAFSNEHSWTMQYRTTRDGEERWLPVPECDDIQGQPACTYQTQNATMLISSQQDPPRVRYKRGTDISSSLGAAIDDLMAIPSRIIESVGGLFGGGG
jgi:hypothetical protein